MSSGIGFVNYTAHGDNNMWYQPQLTNSGVNSLTNTNKYFLAMGNCCLSGNFGYNSACFGEAMIRAENKGAYSYIGSCPNTYWYEDYYFGIGATNTFGSTPNINNTKTGVYDAVWMDDTYNTVSSMTFLGNIAVCYSYTGGYTTSSSATYYWQAYHVLGDGSIMPYRVNPTANTVSHLPNFPVGATSFTVNAEAGSYVGLSHNNVLIGAALVGPTGSVNVEVTPVTSGQVKVVVTKPQRQPYMQDIDVSGSAPTTYQITTTANPSDGGTVSGEGSYYEGATCTLTTRPYPAYNFISWTENGIVVSTERTYTFTVTKTADYVANFEMKTFEVLATADPAEGGTVSITGDNTYGSTVTVSIEPNEDYEFLNWTENGTVVSEEASYTFTLTANHNLVAHLHCVASVGENSHQALNIYPNPVSDKLTIETSEAIGFVEIYNLTGAMVVSQECNSEKAEIDVNNLHEGIYFIRITTDSVTSTRRFVKE